MIQQLHQVQGFDLKGSSALWQAVFVCLWLIFCEHKPYINTMRSQTVSCLDSVILNQGKNKPKRISDEISNSVNAFQSSVKTLVGFASSHKTKLGQIILRKVVVA